MTSFGKAMKSLFWQSGEDRKPAQATGAAAGDEDVSADELANMLAGSDLAVPAGATEPVEAGSVQLKAAADGSVVIDFQAQYDAAGIPDTDEVEQLENFLTRLDRGLPQVSKIAAAQAFLGAIGKDPPAVLADAERKIRRVRGILQAQEQETTTQIAARKSEIDGLQARIDEQRKQIEELNRQLEAVRHACTVEESRLQAARVFFGSIKPA